MATEGRRSPLWDRKEVYEVINYQHLIAEAAAAHFPLVILRLSVAVNSSERFVRMCGMVQAAGKSGRGICAGCGAATMLIKVH